MKPFFFSIFRQGGLSSGHTEPQVAGSGGIMDTPGGVHDLFSDMYRHSDGLARSSPDQGHSSSGTSSHYGQYSNDPSFSSLDPSSYFHSTNAGHVANQPSSPGTMSNLFSAAGLVTNPGTNSELFGDTYTNGHSSDPVEYRYGRPIGTARSGDAYARNDNSTTQDTPYYSDVPTKYSNTNTQVGKSSAGPSYGYSSLGRQTSHNAYPTVDQPSYPSLDRQYSNHRNIHSEMDDHSLNLPSFENQSGASTTADFLRQISGDQDHNNYPHLERQSSHNYQQQSSTEALKHQNFDKPNYAYAVTSPEREESKFSFQPSTYPFNPSVSSSVSELSDLSSGPSGAGTTAPVAPWEDETSSAPWSGLAQPPPSEPPPPPPEDEEPAEISDYPEDNIPDAPPLPPPGGQSFPSSGPPAPPAPPPPPPPKPYHSSSGNASVKKDDQVIE